MDGRAEEREEVKSDPDLMAVWSLQVQAFFYSLCEGRLRAGSELRRWINQAWLKRSMTLLGGSEARENMTLRL